MIDKLKALLGLRRDDPANTVLIYVYLPEVIEPEVRHARYEVALDAELRLRSLGFVSGGGTLLSEEADDGSREILSAGVDVDATDVSAARDLLREELPSLGCPVGTQLQYEDDGRYFADEYDGANWSLALPQPSFDD